MLDHADERLLTALSKFGRIVVDAASDLERLEALTAKGYVAQQTQGRKGRFRAHSPGMGVYQESGAGRVARSCAIVRLAQHYDRVFSVTTGSILGTVQMLDFASRHNIAPQTEHFPMSRINEAFARLESGKARYRVELDADF